MRHPRGKFKKNKTDFVFTQEEYLDNATAKINVTNLPPRLDAQEFFDNANLTNIDNWYYMEGHDYGDIYSKPIYSRAYISFKTEDQARNAAILLKKSSFADSEPKLEQKKSLNDTKFVVKLKEEEKSTTENEEARDGVQNRQMFTPIVSKAAYLEMPKHIFSYKRDPKWGTIQEKSTYKLFLSYLEDPSSDNADKVLESCYPRPQKRAKKKSLKRKLKGKKSKNRSTQILKKNDADKNEKLQKSGSKKEQQKAKRLRKKARKEAKISSDATSKDKKKKGGRGNRKGVQDKIATDKTKGKDNNKKDTGKKHETSDKSVKSGRAKIDERSNSTSNLSVAKGKSSSGTAKPMKKRRKRKRVKKHEITKID